MTLLSLACVLVACEPRSRTVVVEVREPTIGAAVPGIVVLYLRQNFQSSGFNTSDTIKKIVTDINGQVVIDDVPSANQFRNEDLVIKAVTNEYFLGSPFLSLPNEDNLTITLQHRANVRVRFKPKFPTISIEAQVFIPNGNFDKYIIDSSQYNLFKVPVLKNGFNTISFFRDPRNFTPDTSLEVFISDDDTLLRDISF